MNQFIHIHPDDTVVVALKKVDKGTVFRGVIALEDIPQGHKMALKEIASNAQVVKYGFSIGHATENIKPGQWVHSHNMATNLSGQEEYTYEPDAVEVAPIQPRTFQGYLRKDGRAAIPPSILTLQTHCKRGKMRSQYLHRMIAVIL